MAWIDEESAMSEINVTPLVDVMLVLLIIFIVTVPVVRLSLPVDLPTQEAAKIEHKVENVHITLQKNGTLMWDDEVIEKGALRSRLVETAKFETQPSVFLNADRLCTYEEVVQLVGLIREAGIKKLGFVTKKTK